MIKLFLTLSSMAFMLIGCGGGATSDATVTNTELGFTPQQRLVADEYISVFENGTTTIQYSFAENIGDGRGITAGRAGFNSATGGMLIVIERYTQMHTDNNLSSYIDELTRLHEIYAANNYTLSQDSNDTSNLVGLEDRWRENASIQDFRDIQDEIVDENYFTPAFIKAKEIGLKMPLSLLSIYDSSIQHGESGLDVLMAKATQMTNNLTPLEGADELTWLINFNENRKSVLLGNTSVWKESVNRVIALLNLIDARNTQLAPFELRITYPNTGLSDDVYYLP